MARNEFKQLEKECLEKARFGAIVGETSPGVVSVNQDIFFMHELAKQFAEKIGPNSGSQWTAAVIQCALVEFRYYMLGKYDINNI